MRNEKHIKLIKFILIFTIFNLIPDTIMIYKIPTYIVWFCNAILTMYLIYEKDRKYRISAIMICYVILAIHDYLFTFKSLEFNEKILLSLGINFANICISICIFKILVNNISPYSGWLEKITKRIFFLVIPVIFTFNLIKTCIYGLESIKSYNFRVFNFFLEDFLGYIFIFIIIYSQIGKKKLKFKLTNKLLIFMSLIFIFNFIQFYIKKNSVINHSELAYISIFVLILAVVLLEPLDFLIVILEDFFVSYFSLMYLVNLSSIEVRSFVLSDMQLFYAIVLSAAFLISILKEENLLLLNKLKVRNEHLVKEVEKKNIRLEKINILFDSMKSSAFIADENGRVVYSNNTFKNLTNEKNIHNIEFLNDYIEKLKLKKSFRIKEEIEVTDLKNIKRFYNYELFLEEHKDGRFIGGIGNEITKLKEVQREIEYEKEKAERANNAKSTFIARVSHELKTPMNSIIGLNYILSQTDITDYQRECLKKIDNSSKLLLRLIEDILDVSTLEIGKIKLKNGIFSLKSVLETVKSIKEDEIIEKNISYIEQYDGNIPDNLIGDRLRIEQVLINLIGNSVKFTKKGFISLSMKVCKEDRYKIWIEFKVEDSGIGIAKEKSNQIFDPFVQEDESITRKYGGTGLGLAICKHIVNAFNGEISLISNKGVGSTFKIIIPFDKVESNKSNIEIISKGSMKTNNKTYLIKDDGHDEIYKFNKYKEIDKNNVLIELKELRKYYHLDIVETMDRIERVHKLLNGTKYNSDINKIKKYMDVFDIDSAVEETENLINKITRM